MLGNWIYFSNEGLIFLGMLAIFLFAARIGYYFGHKQIDSYDEEAKQSQNMIQGALLGLLALLLAFTFSMAVSRYDIRKQLILDEANAIGTTYLRAQLLDEPYKSTISRLLLDYIDVRVAFYQAGVDVKKLQTTIARSEQLQKQLWEQATAASKLDIRAVTTGLFIQSLNDTIDMHAKRFTAMTNRVPDIVFILIFIVATCTIGMIGFGSGFAKKRSIIPTLITIFLIASVILTIIDLDRPSRGLIKTGQEPMINLQQSLENPTTEQPKP